jgi:hypothetical protein
MKLITCEICGQEVWAGHRALVCSLKCKREKERRRSLTRKDEHRAFIARFREEHGVGYDAVRYRALDDEQRAAERLKGRHQSRKFLYGLSESQYMDLLEAQDWKCMVCGEPEQRIRAGQLMELCVDHDHLTGRVRGLLCSECNSGLGKFHDSPSLLRAALLYLEVTGA